MTVASDFNLQKINTKELAANIEATIQFGGNLIAIAKRGTGKTSIANEVIARSKFKGIYFNLSLMERPDLGGYPDFFNNKKDKFINFLMPSIYRELMEGDQRCVAILDEVDKADSALLAPLLEFVQFRSVNGNKLKNLHAVLMTGNLPEEGGARPPLPLLDRTEKYLVEINPEHWLDWAAKTGKIHPSCTAYIADNLNDLSAGTDDGESYSSTSPRSWENASLLASYGEKNGWHPNMILHKVAGCVGKKVGIKYAAFFEHYQVLLPIVEKIMKGDKVNEFDGFEPTKKLIVCMILCSRFARMLDHIKEQTDTKISNYKLTEKAQEISNRITQFMQNIDPEMSLISIRGQIGPDRVREFNLFDDTSWDYLLTQLLNRIG